MRRLQARRSSLRQTRAWPAAERAFRLGLLGCLLSLLLGWQPAQAQAPFSGYITMSGTTDGLTVPGTVALDLGPAFTLEAWVKPDASYGSGTTGLRWIFHRYDVGSNQFAYALGVRPNGALRLQTSDGTTTSFLNFSSTNIPTGSYSHVAATLSAGVLTVYVNGSAIGSIAGVTPQSMSSGSLYMGLSPGSGGIYNGELDELRVWNVARTPAQILASMNSGLAGNEAGLVGYWNMNRSGSGSGLSVANMATATGAALNATTVGTMTTPVFNGAASTVPALTAVSPARNAASASRSTSIALTFSEAMSNASASATALKVYGGFSGLRGATYSGGGSSTLTVAPSAGFRAGERVDVTVTAAATSSASNTPLARGQVSQFVAATGAGTGTFSGSNAYSSLISGPTCVTLGDLNGDGNLDAALANYNGSTTAVYFGNGSGAFANPISVGNTQPHKVTMGDVDGDGDLDLVTPNYGAANITVHRNNGSGAFTTLAGVACGSGPTDVALGDLDGDGDLDAAVSNYFGSTGAVLFNDGSGNFSGLSTYALGTSGIGVVLGDLDNDGDLDMIQARYSGNNAYVYLNSGSGSFTYSSTITLSGSPYYPQGGDLDNDGNFDYWAAINGGTAHTIAWGNGSGGFTTTTVTTPQTSGTTAAAGDVDGDGRPDLVFSGGSSSCYVLRNLGSRSFATPAAISLPGAAGFVALGDLNGDNALDFVGSSYGSSAFWPRLNTSVGPPTITAFSPSSGTPGTVVTLTGTNLSGLTSLTFNGTAASGFTANGAGTQVTVAVPAGATTGPIAVTNSSGSATSASSFTVLPAPTISGFSPGSAAAGSTVTITGTNLTGVTGVLFGGVSAASFSASSGTTLTAVPSAAGASGPITLIYGSGSTVSSTGSFTLLLPNVMRVEYFVDTDPGRGSATSVPLTAAADVANLSFGVPLASLSAGFHRLGARSRDAAGMWSLTTSQTFYYEPLANQAASNIVRAEYFIDTDPGFGAGTSVPVPTPGTDVAGLVFNVDLSSVSAGFHRLSTRTRDANGKWSLTTSRSFYFEPALAQPTPNIVRAEYFLNTDPGFGLGVNIPLGTPLTDVNGVAFNVDLSSLPAGFHRLNVRSRDAYGRWSLTSGRNFYFEPVSLINSVPSLTRLEYFIDTDPGFGLGTAVAIPASSGSDAANVGIVVPLGSLSTGFHRMNIRGRDASGKWGLTTVRSFYYEPLPAAAPNIVRAEYFFDNDPGFGLGTPVAVNPAAPDVAGLGIVADASALANGLHRFSLRVRDASGRWSLVTSRTFTKNGCASSPNFAASLPGANYSQGGSWGGGSAENAFNNPAGSASSFLTYSTGYAQVDFGSSALQTISDVQLRIVPQSGTNLTLQIQTSANLSTWTTVDTYTALLTGGQTYDIARTLPTVASNVRGLRLLFGASPNAGLVVSGAGAFYFNCSGPTIASFSPTGGPAGTTVVITGTNLSGVTGVTFNGTPVAAASITANSATSVTVVAPAGGSSGQICLTAAAGSTCSAPSYNYPATIATGTVSPTSFCSSTFIQVPFTTNFAGYGAGNQFGFQLSDANGVFSAGSRVYGILSYQSGSNGVLTDSVALRTPAGSGYRVRVVATNPATVGSINGQNLTILPTPLATASAAPATVAYNGSINLSAGPLGQSSYQWYVRYLNGSTAYVGSGQSLTVSNAQVSQSGLYMVYVSNASGCQDSASVRVTVQPSAQPILTLSQFGGSLCAGTPLSIGFAVNGNSFASGNVITAQLSDASGSFVSPTSIGSVSFVGQGNGYVNATIPVGTPQGSGYRIRLLGSNPSVVSSGDNGANLTINALPAAVAGSNSPVAYGGTLQLTAQTVPGATYQWYGPNFYSTQQNPTIANATIAQNAGTYQLVVTLNNCQSSTTTNVTVSPSNAPILTMAQFGGGPLCAGSSTLNISFNVTGNSFASGNTITAQLSDASGSFGAPVSIGSVSFVGQGNGVVSAAIPAGTPTGSGYRIRLIGSNPGVASQTDNGSNIGINAAPAAVIVANNSPVAYNGTVTLTAQAVSGATYMWSVPGVGNVSTGSSPTLNVSNAQPGNSGTYGLTVVAGGCSSTTSASVTVLPAGQPIVAIAQFSGTICAGSSLNIGFNVSGASFTAGTTLTAQLSNDTGSFAAPVSIGSTTFGGQGNGSIAATIPGSTIQGGFYRIRLVASAAATMNPADNGANISISTQPAAVVAANNSPVTAGSTITLTAQAVAGATYQWVFNSTLVGTNPTLSISNAQAANAGTYTLIVTLGTCQNSTTTSVTVNTPSASLATGSFGGSFCPGSFLSVPFTASGFNAGNVFTAQLSSASGSFASPTNIGTLTATASGSISAQIPLGTAAGTGYRIRVVASSPATVGADNGQNLTVGPISYTWTGGAGNTDWFNAQNWSCGQVPGNTSVVIIPSGLTFYPIITGGTATALHLTVQSGATFTVNSSFNLYGNVTVNGTWVAGTSSTWSFVGTGNQFVYGTTAFQAGNIIIGNGSVLNAANLIHLYGNWTNNGSFLHGGSGYGVVFNGTGSQCVCGPNGTSFYNFTVVNGATVNLGVNTAFSGNVVVNGTFSAATYGVVLNGSAAQTLGGSGTSTFYHVTINNTMGGVTLNDDITVLGNWINNGAFASGSYSVLFAGSVAQIIDGTQVTNFYNVTFSNAISVTLHQNIHVLGGFVNTGVFYGYYTVGGVTTGHWVRFGGTVAQVINASATTYFYHFYVDNLAGVSLASNIYIAGNYHLYSGSFNPGTYTVFFNGHENLVQTVGGYSSLTFYGWNIVAGAQVRLLQNCAWLGSFVNSGSFYGYNLVGGVYTGYTCTFGGNVAQVLSGTGLYEFWHITISNVVAGGVTFNAPVYVWGNWLNNGVFFCGTSTVYFNGRVAQTIGGSTASTTFHHISIGNTLASVTLAQQLIVLGNWLGNGVFLGGTYLVHFNGTAAQTIFCGSINTRFYSVQISNPVSVTLLSDVYLNGNWTHHGGFVANGYTVFFSGSSLQLITGTANTLFHHLTILPAATVQPTRAITLLGNWTCGGTYLHNSFNVTFAGNANQVIGGTVITPFFGVIINSGAIVTLAQDVRIRGGWTNNGTFNPATFTVYFDGSIAQLIGGQNPTTFHHVQFLNTASNVTLGTPIFVRGNWYNAGLFAHAGYLVTFNGSALQTIGGTVPTTFHGITCNNAVGVALGYDIRVHGDFRNLALFTAGGHVVTFNGGIAQGIYSTGTLTFHDVVFANGLGVTLHNGVFLTGNWTNNGGFLHNGQLVTFNGTAGTQLITGSVASVFHHLTIALNATVRQNLAITLMGNWINNGSFLHNNLLVSFLGTALQTIGGSMLTTFYDVTFNNPVNVSLAHDIDIVRHFVNQGGFCGCGFTTRFNGTVPQTITCSSGRTSFHHLTFANMQGVTMLDNVGVTGNWVNNGGFIANGYLVLFNGTAAQTIGGSVLSAFHHMTITNTAGTGVSLLQNVSVAGNWVNAGHYCGCGFTTLFNGSAAQSLTCSTGQSNFHHLTLANTSPGGVTLTGNINVAGNWLVSGAWFPQTYTVFFTGTGAQTIGLGGGITRANFHHLTIANTSTAGVTLGANTPLWLTGNFANNGTFGCGQNGVWANGTTLQTFGGTRPTTFYDWTVL
ncbi:FG-GAP-like repeat-containing protein, partial [Hymenobacter saemangeumensis]|uniref:FG-GAP-like repeat-containing protein n=1 Tax=Hymenobacter saemangeumensis TaxID=1084522 RepID=UPI0031E924E1